MTEIVRYGGVLLLDEVNMLHPRIGAVLHSLLDKRRVISLLENQGEIVKAHAKCVIVATYNPGYEGTRPLNPAFKNRFAVKMEFDYDPKVEKALVYHPVLLDVAKKLRASFNEGEITTPVSTNMLMEFEDFADMAGVNFAMTNFLNAFPVEERTAVKQFLDMHAAAIGQQFAQEDIGPNTPDVEADLKDEAAG